MSNASVFTISDNVPNTSVVAIGRRRVKPSTLPQAAPNAVVIQVTKGDLASAVTAGEDALIARGGIYQRGLFLVRPGILRADVGRAEPSIVKVAETTLGELLTSSARWRTYDARSGGWVSCDCPSKVVRALLGRVGHWRLPVLAGIVNGPTLRPNGTVLDQPGFDSATGLIVDFAETSFPNVPDNPTRQEARDSLAVLLQLLISFPFVTSSDRSVALSAILTAVCRQALPTAPMHAFTAPTAGSGKSMLVDIISLIATGHDAAVVAQGQDEGELEKRLSAALLAGSVLIAIDNCERPLCGELVCSMLTQERVTIRPLGRTEVVTLPSRALLTATGNNFVLAGDMTRRALLCSLDPQVERPELRRFAFDPKAAIRADRGRYLVAALTILRAFHVAGRPQQADRLGSFETWSQWVRDALIWLGQPDPVATMERIRANDPRLELLRVVHEQWHRAFGADPTTVARMMAAAKDNEPLRQALLLAAERCGVVDGRVLGRFIGSHRDRVIAGRAIVREGTRDGSACWRLKGMEGFQ